MRRRGLTLIEIVVVLALTATLTAILTPVFAAARRRGQIASSLGVLHQLHLGAMLYQENYGGGGAYGDLPEMGLPSVLSNGIYELSPSKSVNLPSPCGLNALWASDGKPHLYQYVYHPSTGGPEFARVVAQEREQYVLFYDLNCDDSGAPLYNESFSHLGLGVTLGGNAFTRRRTGLILSDAFWAP